MSRRTLTDSDRVRIRRLRAKGTALEAIAVRLEVSKSAVHRAVKGIDVDARITANRARAGTPPSWLKDALKLIRSGHSRFAVARELGIPKSVVYRAIDRFG